MNMNKLKEAYESSATAQTMFTDWALRKRNRSRLTLRRYKSRIAKLGTCDSNDFLKTFKIMEEAGAGHFIYRNSRPIQWEWSQPVKDVGCGVVGGSQLNETRKHFARPQIRILKPISQPKQDQAKPTIAIPLSGGRSLTVNLEDISSLSQVLDMVRGKL